MLDRLKACGLFTEIISWKLRLFVPTDRSATDILAKLFERYQIKSINVRERMR
jgi:hypothetical protein